MTKDDALAAVKRYAADARLLNAERDKAIVNARNKGATLREIGIVAGLSGAGVAKIVVRRG